MRLTFLILTILINYLNIIHAQMECPVDKIYPQSSDFSGDECGRILINKPTGTFYTSYQTEEGEIRIKAVLGSEYVGQTVYFRIIDPDDMSPYEQNLDGDDNGDKVGYKIISHSTTVNVVDQQNHIYSTTAVEGFESGVNIAQAEVILEFTDHYSGDNYKVLCNTDPLVPTGNSAETVCMVAWKRQGLVKYFMYRNGSFLRLNRSAGQSVLSLYCFDYDENLPEFSDFAIGDEITIWDNSSSGNISETAIISDIQSIYESGPPQEDFRYEITLQSPLQNAYNKFAGVRRTSSTEIFSFNEQENFRTDAYGGDSCGEDGGTFVEFRDIIMENPVILPSADFNCVSLPFSAGGQNLDDGQNWSLYQSFQEYWFEKDYEGSDIFTVTCARRRLDNGLGRSQEYYNSINVYCQAAEEQSFINFDIQTSSVLMHEIGHQFIINNNHYDSYNYVLNHEGSDFCIMNWDQCGDVCHYANDIVEFDIIEEEDSCIHQIRKQEKGL